MTTTDEAIETAPVPTGDIRTAALQFLRWAHDHGLLASDAYYPGATIGAPNFGLEPTQGAAIGVLRTRQVRFVGVDAGANRIAVFFRRSTPSATLLKVLPKFCNGFALRYHQGNPETVSPSAVAEATSTCAVHSVGGNDYYTCGSSMSIGNNREAGTLGCLVRDAHGELHGLSNNHVAAACSYAPVGMPVIAPGVIDVVPGNPLPFTLGIHARQLPLVAGDPTGVDHTLNSDAAIFKIVNDRLVSSMQRNHHDTPTSVMDLAPGMAVQKVGRTTDLTNGVVHSEVIGASPIGYSASQYGFSGNVFFEPLFIVHGIGDIFSEGGDSGSLITHLDAAGVRHAVGIVVAGCVDNSAPGGKRSIVLPLRPILHALQVTLVSVHNC